MTSVTFLATSFLLYLDFGLYLDARKCVPVYSLGLMEWLLAKFRISTLRYSLAILEFVFVNGNSS